MIIIKTAEEIDKMRVACKLAADVLVYIRPFVIPGISTNQINDLCHNYIINNLQAVSATLNYNGFPKSICTSVNDVICHGIPNDKPLKDGDILNIDVTVIKNGYYGDTSAMYEVGKVEAWATNLSKITKKCMYQAIMTVKPGTKFIEIGRIIANTAHSHGFSVVQEYTGHGIGLDFHEDPHVFHYANNSDKYANTEMLPGMIFTIEPMINQGLKTIKNKADKWTYDEIKKLKPHLIDKDIKKFADDWVVVTADKKLSAQWEHTVLVTETGYDILTLREDEDFPKCN